MSDKIGKLQQAFVALHADVEAISKNKPIHGVDGKDGRDGVSPEPIHGTDGKDGKDGRDGTSPEAVHGADGKNGRDGKDGRDGVSTSVTDVAAVVLAKIRTPKDGVSPDPAAVAALVPVPKNGKDGRDGKDGKSITDVELDNNELFVEIDGDRRSVGEIILPVMTAPFAPGNGGGGGSMRNGATTPYYSKQVVVTKAVQMSGDLRSDVVYFLDGIIDFTGTGFTITIPSTGLSIKGHTFDVSGLKCDDDNFTLFDSPVGGSGNLLGVDYLVDVNGVDSQVYDLVDATGFNAFEFQRINYNNCSSLGEISGYRQGLEEGTGRFGGKPELTLSGAWVGGFFIDVSIVRGLDDGSYSLFKAGPGFSMASRFRSNQNLDLPASASFIDFTASNFVNPSTLQLMGCLVTRNGVVNANDSNILPNITASELVCDWSSNNGIPNTFVGGELVVTSELTTTIIDPGVFVDLAGVYTADSLQHFDSPANGQLRHLGQSPIEYSISGELIIDSGQNDEVDLKLVIFRAASTTFVDGKTVRRVINNLQGARDVAYFTVSDNILLNQNDYIKLQVANVNDTDDITAELDSFFSARAR